MKYRPDVIETFRFTQQLDPNNMPMNMVPTLSLPPAIMQYIPFLTGSIINDIGMNCDFSPERRYTYNQISQNSFVNQDMYDLVNLAAKILAVTIVESSGAPIAQILPNVVTNAIRCHVSRNVHSDRDLMGYMNPGNVNQTTQYINYLNYVMQKAESCYDIIAGTVNNQYNQNMVPNVAQPANNFINQGFNNRFVGSNIPVGQPNLNVSNVYDRFNNGAVHNGKSNFNTNVNTGTMNVDNTASTNKRFAPVAAPTVPVQAPVVYGHQRKTTEFVLDTANEVNNIPSFQTFVQSNKTDVVLESDWRPSAGSLYKTVISENTHTRSFKNINIAGKNVVIEVVKSKGGNMDREAHVTKSVSGAHGVSYFSSTRINSLNNNLDSLSRAVSLINSDAYDEDFVQIEETDGFKISDYLDPVWGCVTNLSDAILETMQLKFMHTQNSVDTTVYRHYALVAEPYFNNYNYQSHLNAINTASSLKDMGTMLVKAMHVLSDKMNTVSENDICEEDIILAKIDDILTGIINDFLKISISTTIVIDKFSQDIFELYDYLRNIDVNYGTCFLNFERELVGTVFPVLTKDLSLIEPIPDPKNITYFTSSVSITAVDVLCSELNLSVNKDEVYVINEGLTPWLHSVARIIFNDRKNTCNLNMLITKDHKKFNIYRGLIGIDTYLLVSNLK